MLAYVIPLCLAIMGLALVLTLARLIKGPDLPDRILALDTLYINAIALLVLLLLLLLRPELRVHAKPRRMGLNLLRNAVHYAAQYAWALSLTMLPLAMVFALEFTMPAWTTLLAVWLLLHRATWCRLLAATAADAGCVTRRGKGWAPCRVGRYAGKDRTVDPRTMRSNWPSRCARTRSSALIIAA